MHGYGPRGRSAAPGTRCGTRSTEQGGGPTNPPSDTSHADAPTLRRHYRPAAWRGDLGVGVADPRQAQSAQDRLPDALSVGGRGPRRGDPGGAGEAAELDVSAAVV